MTTTSTTGDPLVVPVPDDADVAVRVRGLAKAYGETKACDGVSLDVVRGEVLALLGPNGAGKTTTTEILEGYRAPRRRRGRRCSATTRPRPTRCGAAASASCCRRAADLGDLTVEESVTHFAGYYPRPRDVDEVIEWVGLTEKRKTRGSNLSGGQRRRLDVALGIIGRPELLFLDEPTTGFDPEARREFWGLIAGLKDEGTTIMLTTHYLDEAEVLADRVAVIARGRVIACDIPSRLGGRDESQATVSWQEGGEVRHQQTHRAHPRRRRARRPARRRGPRARDPPPQPRGRLPRRSSVTTTRTHHDHDHGPPRPGRAARPARRAQPRPPPRGDRAQVRSSATRTPRSGTSRSRCC